MTNVQIILPKGALGLSGDDESPLEFAMRIIGVAFAEPHEWAAKYGTNYENDVFVMRTQYWGDCTCGAMNADDETECEPTCPMVLPNFLHKASGFQVEWYKYIGRSMETKGTPPADLLEQVFASHPRGMTVEQAATLLTQKQEESAELFRQVMAGDFDDFFENTEFEKPEDDSTSSDSDAIGRGGE